VRAGIDIALHAHSRDEDLPYYRARASRWSGQHRIVNRNIAPAEHRASFVFDHFFDCALACEASCATSWEKQHAHTVAACIRQSDRVVRAGAAKKCVRHLKQNARTVASAGISRDSASVRKISEQLERLVYNIAGTDTMDVRDKTDSARVMFVGRVV
jgi:hypothetical protein